LCLAVANGDRAALPALLERLAAERPRLFALWPPDRRDLWGNGIELILEPSRATPPAATDLRLLEALLQVAYDSPAFRDRLAAGAHQAFPAYADPAGLIQALGIPDRSLPIPRIARRWQAMQGLLAETLCHHPVLGLGTVLEVDGFANQVQIQFTQKRTLPLDQALETLLLIRGGSFLARLLRKETTLDGSLGADQVRQQTAAAIVPQLPCTDELLRQLYIPAILSETEFQKLLSGSRAARGAISKLVEPGKARQWYQARNLEELSDILEQTPELAAGDAELAAVHELYTRFGMKTEQAPFAAQAAGRLWSLSGGDERLRRLFQEAVSMTRPWHDKALFVEISDGLPGKIVAPWFEATLAACGLEWLCEAATDLPNRLFTPLGKILARTDDGPETFLDDILARVQRQTASPDMLLWLWKSKRPEREIMADPTLVFKSLANPVRGNYIKANKELRKLLMEDEEFQRFLMLNGDPETIAALVSCIRHVPLLDNGEQQSLLVKIVRLFPDSKPLVEQRSRSAAATVRKLDRITSIRSFELLRRELDDIITVQIPANSHAIGHARGYGDLRENAEFKSAKEHQRLLRLRRNELERLIHEIKAFDFATTTVAERVIPGAQVTLRHAGGRGETLAILGLRDGNPEKGHISYESPLGKQLVGKAQGDTVALPNGSSALVVKVEPLPADLQQWLRGEDLL
jgi:transcription elongation GreA/GreB family factor